MRTTTCRPVIGRRRTSCRVVRPRPVPREIQARNVRAVTTAGAWPNDGAALETSAAPAAAAAPFLNSRRRESEVVMASESPRNGSIYTSRLTVTRDYSSMTETLEVGSCVQTILLRSVVVPWRRADVASSHRRARQRRPFQPRRSPSACSPRSSAATERSLLPARAGPSMRGTWTVDGSEIVLRLSERRLSALMRRATPSPSTDAT